MAPPARPARRWVPRRVVVTPAALDHPHGRRILARVEAAGLRWSGCGRTGSPGCAARPSARPTPGPSRRWPSWSPAVAARLQPIPPSADWRVDLAEGCPAHCQYCYLAGSLSGPPVTRVYADLDEILAGLTRYAGAARSPPATPRAGRGHHLRGVLLHRSAGIEHLTGSWRRPSAFRPHWDAAVQLRWTTKFDDVDRFWGCRTPAVPACGFASTACR